MGTIKSFLTGLGIGAAFMYVGDPQRGRRRRSIARDKVIHGSRVATHGLEVAVRDLSNRTRGTLAETRKRFSSDGVSDAVLEERVRSKIGRVVGHPRAIHVSSRDGLVHLAGPILDHEVEDLLEAVQAVPGVREVSHRLDLHEEADIPSLQGGRERPGFPGIFGRDAWTPATRLVVGMCGGLLGVFAAQRRGVMGTVAGMVAGAAIARTLTNQRLSRLVGFRSAQNLIDVHKTVHLNAPVDAVFSFWDRVENFPAFMRNVRNVENLGDGRSRWTVIGPAGTKVHWEAEVSDRVENEKLAWRTTPGSTVQHTGMIRFMPDGEHGTRIDIHLSYTPPAGAIGHAVATLFGADPKHELDEDLVRMKTLIETGKVPHDAARPELIEESASPVPHQPSNGI